MLVVFFLVSKYQNPQNDQGQKTKIMMIGMVLVIGWMFFAPHLKPQKLAL